MQPAKRARTGEDIPLDECTRHANLYLEDGNVVLRCDNVLFKIYRGLLSRNSEIFRDMFSLSIHQPVDAEQYEGSPMICLHDSAADFESFMLALLDSSFIAEEKIPFSVFAGILRISTKYEVPAIRRIMILRIRKFYSSSFDEFPIAVGDEEAAPFEDPSPHPNSVVNLLEECNVRICLPSAMYLACGAGLTSVMCQDRETALNPDTMRTAVLGLADLISREGKFLRRVFDTGAEDCYCIYPGELELSILRDRYSGFEKDLNMLVLMPLTRVSLTAEKKYCERCIDLWVRRDRYERLCIWTVLPEIFGLPSWDKLEHD